MFHRPCLLPVAASIFLLTCFILNRNASQDLSRASYDQLCIAPDMDICFAGVICQNSISRAGGQKLGKETIFHDCDMTETRYQHQYLQDKDTVHSCAYLILIDIHIPRMNCI